MELRILGPVEILASGGLADIGHARQRSVLAILLLDLNRVVPAERLIDRVWGDESPGSARNLLSGYVAKLRAAIRSAGARDAVLYRRAGGYVLEADPERVDLYRFRRQVAQAGIAGDQERAALLRRALGLWRGEALAGLDSPWLRAMRDTLEQERMSAILDMNDIDLRQGRHSALIGELTGLAVANPGNERLAGQLMLALHRSGRTAEALRCFEQTRQRVAAELGVDPGEELRNLHERILRGDGLLSPAERDSHGPVSAPRELPADVTAFTGRVAELTELDRLLAAAGQDGVSHDNAQVVLVSAISGTAGVGKTALAVRWAHRAAERFPDGQLYVNLRGYDEDQPVSAADALAGFLRSLGVPGQDIPPEADQRAARYRSLLADKKMLVVLDNARSADQVRPLLPGTSACAALITSRDALAGLVAKDGAARLDLDVLPLKEAVALLRRLIGSRVDADPEAAAELAGQCCRLPLALRVAAELAVARPAMPLSGLTAELADLHTRLDVLAVSGDPHAEVRTVFSWSCRFLRAEHARIFGLLGLHPGPDLDPYATTALTGATVLEARRTLDVLARAHLIFATSSGRYGMHDLLRGYARELSATANTGEEQHAALTRLFDYYLNTAVTAMDILYPAEHHYRPRIGESVTPIPPLADPTAARDWLDAERATLVAVARHTAAHGWPAHTTTLATTLSGYLRNGGHASEALIVFGHALGAARSIGDRAAEASALSRIGGVYWRQSRLHQALDHHLMALALFREIGDRAEEADELSNIGIVETSLGRYEQAARHQQEAVAICRDVGDHSRQARTLGNLGLALRRQGRYREAAGHYRRTLDLFREIGDRHGEAGALARLGVVDQQLGRYQDAAGYLERALTMLREIGDAAGESETLLWLGRVYLGLGRYGEAARHFEQARTVSSAIEYPGIEADALNGLGDVLSRTGEAGKARACHATALQIASEAGLPHEQASAHSGLARAWQADGDPLQARHHWHEALTRYTAIGAPEADEIRARLAIPADSDA